MEIPDRAWDIGLKIVATAGVLLGAFVGIGEYLYSQAQMATLETAKFEADQHKPILDRQIANYFEATTLAATIALTDDQSERSKLQHEFFIKYFGPMVIIEDRGQSSPSNKGEQPKYSDNRNVESKMIAFGACLQKNCRSSQLKQLSLELADACRLSLLQDMQARVDALQTGLNITKRLKLDRDEEEHAR
jgi:hypothetical protein